MTVNGWLKAAREKLTGAGIGTARLDSLVLLEDVTERDRGWLLANPESEITPGQRAKLTKLLSQRTKHTPLAYVRGMTEFYGRNFVITPAVLEPRPESETMIDLLGDLAAEGKITAKTLHIADVGTGSGALGITAKLEFPPSRNVAVDLLEIDPKAAKIAKINVEKHTTSISVIESDLLDGSKKNYDILLCNLPYVPDGDTVNRAASREPSIAIFGGPDGLDLYRKLFLQVQTLKKQPLYILTESLPSQHDTLAITAREGGYELEQSEDFIQVFRRRL